MKSYNLQAFAPAFCAASPSPGAIYGAHAQRHVLRVVDIEGKLGVQLLFTDHGVSDEALTTTRK